MTDPTPPPEKIEGLDKATILTAIDSLMDEMQPGDQFYMGAAVMTRKFDGTWMMHTLTEDEIERDF